MAQRIKRHLNTDSSVESCQFKSASNGSVKSGGGEDITTQSILYIDAPRGIMQQRSGGLENSKFLNQTRQTPFTEQKLRTHNLQTQ